MSGTTMSTGDNYDEALDEAFAMLDERVARDETGTYPDGEREKAMDDALNNVWVSGITVAEWVDRAVNRFQ